MSQAEAALRVENVAVKPDVRVGEAVAACACISKQLERTSGLTVCLGHHGQTARCHSFPARISELAGSGERLAKQVFGSGWVVAG